MEILDKKAMRSLGLKNRRSLTNEERRLKSDIIVAKILSSEDFQRAKSVFCYVAMEEEVHTRRLLEEILKAGKVLSIPYIAEAKKGLMYAARLESLDDLTTGLFDIMTVPESKLIRVEPGEIDFVVVPGVAFDRAGHRIGMGGGYYDRFLTSATAARRCAIAYECQVFENLPVEKYDQNVDIVFTESGIY